MDEPPSNPPRFIGYDGLDEFDDAGADTYQSFAADCEHQPRVKPQSINRCVFIHCARCGGESPRFRRHKKAKRWWSLRFSQPFDAGFAEPQDVMELDE